MRVLLTGSFVAGLFVLFLACSGSDSTTNIPAEAGATSSSGSTSGGSTGSSGSTSNGGASSGTSSGSTGTSGTNTGGDCTPLTQEGPSVDVISTKEEQPAATGGAPVEGKFVLKKVRAFAAIFAEGTNIQKFGSYTLQLKAGLAFEQAVTNKDGGTTEAKGKLVVKAPNEFTATPDCETPPPDGGGVTILAGKYSVESNGSVIKMYVVRQLNITAELTFEKVP
jgi:hypothetical protein